MQLARINNDVHNGINAKLMRLVNWYTNAHKCTFRESVVVDEQLVLWVNFDGIDKWF